MKKVTKTIIEAAIAADDEIRCEVGNAALSMLAANKTDAPPVDVGQVLKASEVGKRLGVTTRTVRVWSRAGLLRPVFGSGRKRLGFLAEDVRAFMESRRPPSSPVAVEA